MMDLGQADVDHLERQAELLERTAEAMERIGAQVERLGSEGLCHVEVHSVGSLLTCKAYFKEIMNSAMNETEEDSFESPTLLGGPNVR